MRTLVLAPETPVPARSGLPLRMLHLARQLARSIDVDVAALGPSAPAPAEPFGLQSVAQDWRPQRAVAHLLWEPRSVATTASAAMRALARRGEWTTVQAHGLAMVSYARATGAPVVFDAADAMSRVMATLAATDSRAAFRPLWGVERLKTARFERAVVRSVSAVTVPAEDEAALFERWGARRVMVIPNGVDARSIPYTARRPGANIVFVGYFRWRPNVEAALELVDRVLPRVRAYVPAASLRLVGKDPPAELLSRRSGAVEVTGTVDDVMPYLREARVAVLPVRAGGGTRIKALEALAAGVPVVATPFAVSELGLRDGEEVLLGRTPADLAAQAVRVIEDEALARRLSIGGRRLVERRFDWAELARPLVELHHQLATRAQLPAAA